MDTVMQSVIKSYLRGVLVAITPLIAIHTTDVWAYVVAVVAGVISPALRAMDSKDPAFGMVADIVDVETDKLAKKTTKKAAPKKLFNGSTRLRCVVWRLDLFALGFAVERRPPWRLQIDPNGIQQAKFART